MAYLFVHEDREYLLDPGERFESDLGILEVPEDVEPGDVVETHLGTGFTVRRLRGPDLFTHLERTGAPMMPRDVGLVVGKTGVAAADRVLDAGTGTGILSAYMGRIGADVVTYEQDPEFAEVARQNMEIAGVADTVEVRTGDITDDLDDLSGFDVLTLDTEDAPTVVERTPTLLERGGSLAVYSPFVENTREVVATATEVGLGGVETLDTIQREMDFDDRGSRPSTGGVGHTGYLTFARRP
ncbi:methyltransferase domain-containing protein [Haloarcula argentinensis]|uniref:Methyltransferase domain-containing protein n=1 Tax=Haloarcula argentinensis TaxID=43776 RepID=A0ABU2EX15_HALAR|nr:methyltransferase domain-containing protein [Haloarcula argentinensis]EMA23597.1 tRNA (adenine-N1-)-methyltransferase [Haloarcula argentinensis DSM 12282]MDS0252796.1 methyltransferase domain-containing protein [Haloarcula argentinensis]